MTFVNKRIKVCEDCGAEYNPFTTPSCNMCRIPKTSVDRKKFDRGRTPEDNQVC